MNLLLLVFMVREGSGGRARLEGCSPPLNALRSAISKKQLSKNTYVKFHQNLSNFADAFGSDAYDYGGQGSNPFGASQGMGAASNPFGNPQVLI